jgi:DNA-binding beta-propeller fold protein YncE
MRITLVFGCCAALLTTIKAPAAPLVGSQGGIVVANRGAGSISVIDVLTSGVNHIPLPRSTGEPLPEPMYVNYSAIHDVVLVGDRANDRVVAFNAFDYSVRTTIPTGDGIWHMWGDDTRNQLWVANEIDKSITVIDLASLSVQTTFNTPADLSQTFGGRPHDVILDPTAPVGYVSMIGVNDPANPNRDYVVAFNTSTFAETNRRAVGDDPHLGLSATNNLLFVPTQGASEVSVLSRGTLAPVTGSAIAIPGAHGANLTSSGAIFYTTNIAGGGANALYAIDTSTLGIAGPGTPDNTSFASPHNIALSPDNQRLFVTHSGATSTKVSIFDTSNPADPVLMGAIDAQLNPFGIAAVPAVVPEPAAWVITLTGVACLLAVWRAAGRRRTS